MQGSLMAPTISQVSCASLCRPTVDLISLLFFSTCQPHLTVIDRVTLGAFEDMGWYQVNYNQSEELVWGNKAGCGFLSNDACSNQSSKYFCHDKSSM